jgi:predicted PhzF superfamily epimerase YddE/YHI9
MGWAGVIVTARQEAGAAGDISSRCFFPNIGLNEDPVTGSAHCVLGPYWATKMHQATIKAHQ